MTDQWVIERPCQAENRWGTWKHSMKNGAWYVGPISHALAESMRNGHDRVKRWDELPAALQRIVRGDYSATPQFGTYFASADLADLDGLEERLQTIAERNCQR